MKKIAIILTLCGVFGIGQNLLGQQANIMYFMKDNPLQHNLNPAFQPECNFYIGFPGFSSLNVSAGNNSLTFSDIYYGKVIDGRRQTVSFLHPTMGQEGIDHFLKTLRNNTRLYSNVGISILSFGFRADKSYFTFDVSNRLEAQMIVPKAIPAVFFRGVQDEDGETVFSLRNLSVSTTAYTQLALGYSLDLDEQWNVGTKFKFLLGHANLNSDFGDLSLKISKERWLLSGNSSIRTSAPGLVIPEREDGTLDLDSIFDFNKGDLRFSNLISGTGAGIDLGVTYNLLENLQFSASVVDLGFIRWSKNLHKIRKEGDFEFDGIVYDINNDSINYWDEYRDMLESMYAVENNPAAYKTWLTTKIHAGVEYSILNDKIGFGLLSKTYVTNKKMFEELIISSNFRPFYPLSVSLGYSLFDGRWSNLGCGLNVNAGPVNFFLSADNIPLKYAKGGGMLIPTNTKAMHVSMGMNFVFGRKKEAVKPDPVENEPLGSDSNGLNKPEEQVDDPNMEKNIPEKEGELQPEEALNELDKLSEEEIDSEGIEETELLIESNSGDDEPDADSQEGELDN